MTKKEARAVRELVLESIYEYRVLDHYVLDRLIEILNKMVNNELDEGWIDYYSSLDMCQQIELSGEDDD